MTASRCLLRWAPEARVVLRPLWGGHDPELAWSSLQLVVDRVMPRLAAAPVA
jgi:hypothetical protein